MKPHLLKINLNSEHSFNVRHDKVPHFYNKWHYHPEVELVYIIKGSGQQFIGDNIHVFKPGDMLLIGANLPHLWRSDEKFLKKKSGIEVEAIVIHFKPDCFGKNFFQLPENKLLAKLLNRAQQAIRIKRQTQQAVAVLMEELLHAANTERIILLLRILRLIAESKQVKPVCTKDLLIHYKPEETERINDIYQYILNNYSKNISLNEIARIAYLSPHSFCRYFKSRTNKTFSRFLIEVRIGKACKMLAETSKSISDICYECGFQNFTNFNRHFKNIVKNTPRAHRKYYHEIKKTLIE
ncbi:MAG: AraC family transcriptional regulator [Chitinophagaceae bacterium]|nr:AraC family transcriptional regulator [Chitinophagaceae bacterium]